MEAPIRELDQKPGPGQALAVAEAVWSLPDRSLNEIAARGLPSMGGYKLAALQKRRDRHQSLNVGSMHPPQTQGKVQSAVRLALSGRYLLHASALTGLIDCQMTSNVPEKFILPIMTGLER